MRPSAFRSSGARATPSFFIWEGEEGKTVFPPIVTSPAS